MRSAINRGLRMAVFVHLKYTHNMAACYDSDVNAFIVYAKCSIRISAVVLSKQIARFKCLINICVNISMISAAKCVWWKGTYYSVIVSLGSMTYIRK